MTYRCHQILLPLLAYLLFLPACSSDSGPVQNQDPSDQSDQTATIDSMDSTAKPDLPGRLDQGEPGDQQELFDQSDKPDTLPPTDQLDLDDDSNQSDQLDQSDPGCLDASQCETGLGCKNGLCGPCTAKAQCRPGEACVGGECTGCEAGPDCAGHLCLDGMCQPCETLDACLGQYGLGYYCAEGMCVPESCSSDVDCMPQGRLCDGTAYKCVDCLSSYQCLESAVYGAGYQCLNGRCSEGNCVSSQDCPAGTPICSSTNECRGCQSTEDGPHAECIGRFGQGWLCTGDGACVEGNCLKNVDCGNQGKGLCGWPDSQPFTYECRPCQDFIEDDACRQGYGLDDLICDLGACVKGCAPGGSCPGGLVCSQEMRCTACLTNMDCAAAYDGLLCVAGTCQDVGCNQEKPCSQGYVCDQDILVCRQCETHAECGPGKVCDLFSFGGDGRCYPGECTLKTQDELCDTNLCVSKTCVPCSASQPCGLGRMCSSGTCVVGACGADADCVPQLQSVICKKPVCLSLGGSGNICTYEALPEGTECDDNNPCTVDTTCDASSSCNGAAKCKDEFACTVDQCEGGVCSFPVASDACLIGGVCRTLGQSKVAESFECQLSQCQQLCQFQGFAIGTCTLSSPGVPSSCLCSHDYSQASMTCNTSNCSFTDYDRIGSGSPACVAPTVCSHIGILFLDFYCISMMVPTWCSTVCSGWGAWAETGDCGCICFDPSLPLCSPQACGDACYGAGYEKGECTLSNECKCTGPVAPDLSCHICDPTKSKTAWTLSDDRCDDGLTCTADRCGENGCFFPQESSTCNIGGVCYANGAKPADNPCLVCNPVLSTEVWSPVPSNTTCDSDGNSCTQDVCNGGGACIHPPVMDNTACESDGNECSLDYCKAGVCKHDKYPVCWLDKTNKLMWQNDFSGQSGMTYNVAKWEYCPAMSLGGYSGWRLPTLAELRTLVRGCPATVTGGTCGPNCTSTDCPGFNCEPCTWAGGPGGAGAFIVPEIARSCHLITGVLPSSNFKITGSPSKTYFSGIHMCNAALWYQEATADPNLYPICVRDVP